MATECFYISIELLNEEKHLLQNRVNFRCEKRTKILIYKDFLLVSDVDNEAGSWWHIQTCYCNFFDSCQELYELCLLVNQIKPRFEFVIVGQIMKFEFASFMEFMQIIYEKIKCYKEKFNKEFGKLMILPDNRFYRFRNKNKKHFS